MVGAVPPLEPLELAPRAAALEVAAEEDGETSTLAGIRRWPSAVAAAVGRVALGTHPAVLTAAVVLFVALGYGINQVNDGDAWVRMASAFPANPGLPASQDYLLSSPVGPALAHLLGTTTPASYDLMSLVVVLLAVGVTVVGLHRRAGRNGVGLGLAVLFASPLVWLLPMWLQKEDPFLVLGAALLVVFDAPVAVGAGAAIMATANPAVAVYAVLALAVMRLLEGSRGPRGRTAAAFVGLAVGGLLGSAYDLHIGAGLLGRASFVQEAGLHTLVTEMAAGWWAWLLGALPVAALLTITARRCRLGRASLRALALLVLTALAVTTMSEDESRVFYLLVWSLVLWAVPIASARLDRAVLARLTGGLLLAGLLLPRLVVEQGNVWVEWLHPAGRLLGT